MTEQKTRVIYHPDIDGVRHAMEVPTSLVGDALSDTYKDLWEVATEPDRVFARRRVGASERELSLEERRRAKLVRRLGILGYSDQAIRWRIEARSDESEPLSDLYTAALAQIALEYGIGDEEIAERVALLEQNPYARPWFLSRG